MKRAPLRRTAMRTKRRATGPTADVVEVVCERAGWSCEICTDAVGDRRGVDHHVHHRRPRGIGGTVRPDTNAPQNLLLLCPGCHDDVESRRGEAQSMGWLVPQSSDPAQVAVLVQRDRWVYLHPSGSYVDVPPGAPS